MVCYRRLMREPSLRTSRLAIAALLCGIAALAGAGFYLGRVTAPVRTAVISPNKPVPRATPSPTNPTMQVMDRADILRLAALAADPGSDAAAGAADNSLSDAIGRRFELALPFGCAGPTPRDSTSPLRWSYDQNEEALRLHVEVMPWEADDWAVGDAVDAIEGFWISRPWSSSSGCPRRADGYPAAPANAESDRTLAIAQFFGASDRREALRSGRPFSLVQRIAKADFAAPAGFRLLLSGRIARVPGSESSAKCLQPGGSERRPVCVLAVELDEVRIENPVSGEVLANWPIGRD